MMKKKLLVGGLVIIVVIQFFIAYRITPDMSAIGKPPHKVHSVYGVAIPLGGINMTTVSVSWGIMLFLIMLSCFVRFRLKEVPGRVQVVFEFIIESFDTMCLESLGDKGRAFMPYITTLFLFILCCNWIGILPFTHIEEPTRDLNTTLGLGIIAFFVSHIAAVRYKGIKRYVADYFEPMIEIKSIKIPNILFAPLNIIGELGKLVSHSFRLYGNILGGAIIIQVISNLTRYLLFPVGLNLFFGLFVGAVQAFVFSLLALTYIAVLVER